MASLSAHGDAVSPETAKIAVAGWVNVKAALGEEITARPVNVTECHGIDGKGTFYVVDLEGGGYVVTSADTGLNPILAYSTDGEFVISEQNALYIMLQYDVAAVAAACTASQTGRAGAGASQTSSGKNAVKWGAYVAAGGGTQTGRAGAGSKSGTAYTADSDISDLRVAPLLKTKWSQSNSVWNLMTPSNYVCGCVATAGAQVMKYWQWPDAAVTNITANRDYTGYVRTGEQDALWKLSEFTTGGTYKPPFGGDYKWDKMADTASSLSTEQKLAMAKIVRDAGMSVCMDYSDEGSGSHWFLMAKRFADQFAYKNSAWYTDISDTELANTIMLSNLDAGLPVGVSVPGHAIVADGYGWRGDTLYVHFNMGWSGGKNYWYATPDLTPSGYSQFTSIKSLAYNIYPPTRCNIASCTVVSGRIIDRTGAAAANVAVQAYNTNTRISFDAKSNDKGIFAFLLPAANYEISADGAASTNITVKECKSIRYSESDIGCDVSYYSASDKAECYNIHDLEFVTGDISTAPGSTVITVNSWGTNRANTAYINMTWKKEYAATSYNIYRSTTTSRPDAPIATGITGTSYDDLAANGLSGGVRYFYWVEAVNDYGSTISSNYDWGNLLVEIAADKSEVVLPPAGGSVTVRITANAPLSGTKTKWMGASLTGADNPNPAVLTISAEANATGAARSGNVNLTAGSGTACPMDLTLAVTQAAAVNAAAPVISPAGGTRFTARPLNVEISCASAGATIHYTLDGTVPTVQSPVYTGPLELYETTTVKALAAGDAFFASDVSSAVFTREKLDAWVLEDAQNMQATGLWDADRAYIDGRMPIDGTVIYSCERQSDRRIVEVEFRVSAADLMPPPPPSGAKAAFGFDNGAILVWTKDGGETRWLETSDGITVFKENVDYTILAVFDTTGRTYRAYHIVDGEKRPLKSASGQSVFAFASDGGEAAVGEIGLAGAGELISFYGECKDLAAFSSADSVTLKGGTSVVIGEREAAWLNKIGFYDEVAAKLAAISPEDFASSWLLNLDITDDSRGYVFAVTGIDASDEEIVVDVSLLRTGALANDSGDAQAPINGRVALCGGKTPFDAGSTVLETKTISNGDFAQGTTARIIFRKDGVNNFFKAAIRPPDGE